MEPRGTLPAGRRGALLLFVLAPLALSACSAPAQPPASGTPSASAPAPSAAPSTSAPGPACAALNGRDALAQWIGQVPPARADSGYQWDPSATETSTYDPCLPASWLVLGIKGPTASSPYQVMLFHQGQYVTTAAEKPFAFMPQVERVADDTIRVTYTYTKPGEATATSSGRLVTTYRFDPQRNAFVRSGDTPPGAGEQPAPGAGPSSTAPQAPATQAPAPTGGAGAANLPAGAWAGAGGAIPSDAVPITSIRPATAYSPETAVVVSGTGNIGCDFSTKYASCSNRNVRTAGPGGDKDAMSFVSMNSAGVPPVGGRTDAMYFEWPDVKAQVMDYGRTYRYKNFACHAEMTGITCWNADTGHGAFMNKAVGYRRF